MSRRTIFALLGALMLALWAFTLTPTTYAETNGLSVNGKILTLDLAAKVVTLKKSDNSTIALKFAQTTSVTRNGKSVRLNALVLGDTVQARYKSNRNLTKFNASGPKSKKVAGILNDALKGSGTVVIGGKSVKTNAETRISRNGNLVSLSQLTRQDKLVAHVKPADAQSAGQPEARDIIADGPEDLEVHGVISALSGNQVTVTPGNGTADVVLNVTDSTMIEVDGEHATLGDLKVGMEIEAAYDPATNNAFSIETDSEGEAGDAHINGTVSAVNTGAGTLTIAPKTGDPVTLNVDASTEVKVNNIEATLQDIQVGMPVSAEYDKATLLAKEIKAGEGDDNEEDAKVEGVVAAVDLNAQTVTISPDDGGADVTLNLTTETEIEVNDEPGALGDIQIGDRIRAEYDPATLDALELKVSDEGTGDGGGPHEEVEGTITAVDQGNATVTIAPHEGDAVTVKITEHTDIKVNGEDATLADVQVGADAKAKYDPTTKEASKLEAGNHDGGD